MGKGQPAAYYPAVDSSSPSVAETATAEELYDRMLALYPRRANPGALWGGSKTAKPTHVIYQQAK